MKKKGVEEGTFAQYALGMRNYGLRRAVLACGLGCFSCVAMSAQRTSAKKKDAAAEVPVASATEMPVEHLDLDMYSRIRDEGFNHSHVMQYASALFDDIGQRLTGSPSMTRANDWTREQLTEMGCANAHLESWGEFGMAWTQVGAGLELVKPDPAVFLAQATPWSPATQGTVTAEVIYVPGMSEESEFAQWKGKLKGKVILYGSAAESPEVDPDKVPQMEHYDAKKLAELAQYPLSGDVIGDFGPSEDMAFWRKVFAGFSFKEKTAKFFAAEGAVAVLVPAGSGGVLHDDTNSSMGWFVYRPEHKQAIPEEVVSDEAWDRMSRLLTHKVPVSVKLHIDTVFGGDHEQGYNTIAEIPGTDPALKDEVVMVGGHLDSWIAGTGATDNGAGAIAAMEAMRILTALGVKPRRTIRIGLWSGEEEGVFGSAGYVENHFATLHFSNDPKDADVPVFLQPMTAPPTMKPEGAKLDAYFNMDNGTGKLLGIYAEGNVGIGAIFAQWMKPLRDLGMTTVSERNTGSTDHVPFQMAGLPGFQFIQDPRDYDSRTHHTNLDTYEHLSEPDLKQAAVVEAIFLYDAAMRDAMLPRPTMPFNGGTVKPLENLYPDAVK
ncbi:MAG: M20/M25/M40 family metallo-hydrolase [Acidobacteriaceae bacterium]